jgi:hypothetical protein
VAADRACGPGRQRLVTIGMQIAIRLMLATTLLASVAASADRPSSKHDFSADIVTRDASGAAIGTRGRLYAASGKIRIETTDAAAGYFLIDGATATALFVRPQQRVFMDARQSTPLTRIFLPVDPSDPCEQWQTAAKASGLASATGGWHCERTQPDPNTVDSIDSARRGASVVEYRVTSPDHAATQGWIATDLNFPVKWRTVDGTTLTLEHVRVEAQPPDLCALPPGYRKSDPQALIDRIKHSDVWAAPPQ